MLLDPIFRKVVMDLLDKIKGYCVSSRIKKKKSNDLYKQFSDLLDTYNTTNSFLYSSLNQEIVYSILKGINVIVRELNIDNEV